MTEPQNVWIVDTSPFIGLAKVGHLDLLAAPTRRVWIAEAVAREVAAGAVGDPGRQALEVDWQRWASQGFIRLAAAPVPAALAAMKLGAGEEAVLALALNPPMSDPSVSSDQQTAIIDDGAGRVAARALGVAVTGTVGVLVQAKEEGRLSAIAPVVRDLQRHGLFLPRAEILSALMAGLGEVWP